MEIIGMIIFFTIFLIFAFAIVANHLARRLDQIITELKYLREQVRMVEKSIKGDSITG